MAVALGAGLQQRPDPAFEVAERFAIRQGVEGSGRHDVGPGVEPGAALAVAEVEAGADAPDAPRVVHADALLGVEVDRDDAAALVAAHLHVHHERVELLLFDRSLGVLAYGVVQGLGGVGRLFGPVIGAAVFVILEHKLGGLTEFWLIYLGAILLLIVLFARGGLVGLLAGRQVAHD